MEEAMVCIKREEAGQIQRGLASKAFKGLSIIMPDSCNSNYLLLSQADILSRI